MVMVGGGLPTRDQFWLLDGEFDGGGGGDFAVEEAAAFGLADVAAEGGNFCFDEEGVAGGDGFAPFDFVGAEEVADFADVFGKAEDEDGSGLGHGFELEDARHDGVAGEVALEEVLVEGEVFDGGAGGVGEVDDAVDEEEGVAVRENFLDVGDGEDGFSFGDGDGGDGGFHAGVFFFQEGSHLGVGSVAGGDGDDVAEDALSAEHEVADDVEGFVTSELVVEAAGLFGHDLFAADDNGVFEGAASNQPLF